ncbi:glycosyltransferase, partial [bacterium]|nr:glycosyltransferase [bacterium]
LRAFAKLRRYREAHLVILGEGVDREKLKLLTVELGVQDDVLMPGHIDNPHGYVARSALFVLSSIFEGLPNALIEALAVGTPVISTDCESGPREILQGGRYGKLVPVGDIDALYRAMLESLDDPESRQVSAEAIDRFDLDRAVDTYLQILLGSA